MKYRKLRIAFSVGWAVLCLLLIALWVRSYYTIDMVRYGYWSAQTNRGLLGVFYSVRISQPAGLNHATLAMRDGLPVSNDSAWYFERWPASVVHVRVPLWFPVTLCPALAAIPWLSGPWRFSLRTLLIATTLLALALGLIIATTRLPCTPPAAQLANRNQRSIRHSGCACVRVMGVELLLRRRNLVGGSKGASDRFNV